MTDLAALERRVAWLFDHAHDSPERSEEYLAASEKLRRAQKKQQERKEAK